MHSLRFQLFLAGTMHYWLLKMEITLSKTKYLEKLIFNPITIRNHKEPKSGITSIVNRGGLRPALTGVSGNTLDNHMIISVS